MRAPSEIFLCYYSNNDMMYMHVDLCNMTLYGGCAAPRCSNDQADVEIAEAKHSASSNASK